MLLQTKVNTEYAKVQRTYVNLQAVQLLASLTPALAATEQRYNATQVIHPSECTFCLHVQLHLLCALVQRIYVNIRYFMLRH